MKNIITQISVIIIIFCFFISCSDNTAKIRNAKRGNLKATKQLVEIDSKSFLLDDETAPEPQYIQMFRDSAGQDNLTFLNTYNNAIYFYRYNTSKFINKIIYDKEGPDGILNPMGYHIKSLDSIYVYDMSTADLVITNNNEEVFDKISLRGEEESKTWFAEYPQYIPRTVLPFIETQKELLLTGQSMRTLPESVIDQFKFTARINLNSNEVNYSNTYPKELYGFNYNWEGEIFTDVYTEMHPDGDKLICSFPISHDLYIIDLKSDKYEKIYAGSNVAGTIRSIDKDPKSVSRQELISHITKTDEYTAIIHDKYRGFYYRFLLKAINDATNDTDYKDKQISVIIMDENFDYLGETIIGSWKEWNWYNSFVTKEGLNIEFLEESDIEEVNMNIKIFIPENI